MNPIDLGVIVVYVLGCTGLGAWLGSRSTGLKGYFLGESNIPAWAVMISIVATETSTATFLSVPGVAYRDGGDMTYLQLPLGYLLGRLIVALVLLPMYFRGEIYTAYQLLESRFGLATRRTASILFLATRTLADGLRLFLAAKVLEQVTGWPMAAAIVAVGVTTIVYTFLGGMKAVIWTDVLQFSIYITGALIALRCLAGELPGGFETLWSQAQASGKLRIFDFSPTLSRPFTFWAGLIGGMVLNTATHGADQLMVQRYLSARSQKQAAGALIASGFVVLAQFALFLFIGVSLFVFYQQFPTGSHDLAPDAVFAAFIVKYVPTGVRGVLIAAIFSAAMGTLSSSLNASANTTVNDLVRPLAPKASERTLLGASRALTVGLGRASDVGGLGSDPARGQRREQRAADRLVHDRAGARAVPARTHEPARRPARGARGPGGGAGGRLDRRVGHSPGLAVVALVGSSTVLAAGTAVAAAWPTHVPRTRNSLDDSLVPRFPDLHRPGCWARSQPMRSPGCPRYRPSTSGSTLPGWRGSMRRSSGRSPSRKVPGAVVLVGRHGKVAYARAFGQRAIEPRPEPMTRDTVFDMASLTKPMATATSVMILIEQGKLRLDDTLGQLLPEFDNHGKGAITVEQLLRHRSGLIADNPLADYADGPADGLEEARRRST